MASATPNGFITSQVTAKGVKNFSGAVSATDLKNSFQDTQEPMGYMLPSGLLFGGACTAVGLVATVPSSTTWYARQIWLLSGDATAPSLVDNQTNYIWGCVDGSIRLSHGTLYAASIAPLVGFSEVTACLLTVIDVASGVPSVHNERQWWARRSNGATRQVYEPVGAWTPQLTTIPQGNVAQLPAGSQVRIYGRMGNSGRLTMGGRLRIDA